ncbi:MAG: hypothetical protein KAR23_02880 [Candidatus Aenigmarchaeota archaeon]|nr:hypothetical protein [Candidatus Aenigmarchaeota archaeon]
MNDVLNRIVDKNVKKYVSSQKGLMGESFLSKMDDVFTFQQYGYNDIVDDIYHEIRGHTISGKKVKKKRRKDNEGIIADYSHDITLGEFKALVSVGVYDRIVKNKLKSRSRLVEMFSLVRMLDFAISNDRRDCEYILPANLKTAMGGLKSQSDQDACVCAKYSRISDENDVHFICALQNDTSPGTISEVVGVVITEPADDTKNNIRQICPFSKRLNDEEYENIKDSLCENHSSAFVFKKCVPVEDYIIQRRDVLVDEIVVSYMNSVFYLDKRMKPKDRLVKGFLNDIDHYAEVVFNRIFSKKDVYVDTGYHQ